MSTKISDCLRDFLALWHIWATGSAEPEEEQPFTREYGLCYNLRWNFDEGYDPVVIQETIGEFEQILTSEFGDDSDYPFGHEAYRRRGNAMAQHLDPIRLAWVERVLESQDVTPRPKFYGQWSLAFEYGQWWATHDNYDASYEGPEDGWVDNGLRISARTLITLRQEIDAINEEKKLGN